MSDKIRMGFLFDFYGGLLSAKQQAACTEYYENDLSYQEIADLEGISRAAVYDMIKHARLELQRYEDLLHLAQSYQTRMQLYQKIKELSDNKVSDLVDQCIKTEIEGGLYD